MERHSLNILVLSFYYRPDLSAGSFRATALVETLSKLVPAGSQIDVLTTQPNRYHSFAAEAPLLERAAGLRIVRVPLPTHRSGMLDQSKAFLAFSRGVIGQVATQDYDIVFATSSRLMTAALGAWIARRKGAKLYLDIRDIFVDTIKDVMPLPLSAIARPVFSGIEKWALRKADKVNLVSAGFAAYFNVRYPQQRFSYFTNGIDEEFLAAAPVTASMPRERLAQHPVTVLYAGNIGEGQGLHEILPALARRLGQKIHFKVIGDGGRKRALQNALSAQGVANVELRPPVNRRQLLEEYRAADVLFLHLNDYEAFKKVLPSKLFEYAALGKPVWAGVSGYAAEFVQSEISNSAVFHPCDVEAAVRSFAQLSFRDTPRATFVEKYARTNISRQISEDLITLGYSDA
jgi:glycosyltransferase involved in cell wall biosynthesis